MELMDELIDAYLDNGFEIKYALNTTNGQVLMDAPETLTGEPEIDWEDDEVSEDLLPVPQVMSNEAYDTMVRFARRQDSSVAEKLITVLNNRKPFRHFKDKVIELGIDDDWYDFEYSDTKEIIFSWLNQHNLSYEILNQKYKKTK